MSLDKNNMFYHRIDDITSYVFFTTDTIGISVGGNTSAVCSTWKDASAFTKAYQLHLKRCSIQMDGVRVFQFQIRKSNEFSFCF